MDALETKELERQIERIWDVAQEMGLDPFPVHFEVVPASIMYEFGAYGLPGRFSHWTHGKAYHQMKTSYDYGLSKIYELVINTNPSYAFLMESNGVLQNMLVAAHVLGHSDFFKNNTYFGHTNRQMLEGAAINAERISKYEFEHGTDTVEKFLDAVLSIEDHIDPNVFIKHAAAAGERSKPKRPAEVHTPYDDLFALGKTRQREKEKEPEPPVRFPAEPVKDLLLFIAEHAHGLEDWQRDVIHIVRNEMLYFLPQMQTKIMNEGWAAYWHVRIMRELDLPEDQFMQFADMHAGVVAPSRRSINPYYIGLKMFEDIERRWDNPTAEEKERFGRPGGEGREKIFDVRCVDNDMSFLRNYLTKDLVDKLDLYIYGERDGELVILEKNWEEIRKLLLNSMVNFGQPYIVVEDGDYNGNGELYLRHRYEGRDLDLGYAEKTLEYVHRLWQRAVHLETVEKGAKHVLSYDGKHHSRSS